MFRRGLGAVSDYSSLVNAAAAKYGLDPALLNSVIRVESSGDPNATSPKGAQGLMQLMPATAASLGVTDPLDPAQNIDAGAAYLAHLIGQFGDVGTALAAYNWGPGNVASGRAIPPSVQAYVANVLGVQLGPVTMPAQQIPGSLIDVSGADASTPTPSILDQIDTSAANVFGLDPTTANVLMASVAGLFVWLLFRK